MRSAALAKVWRSGQKPVPNSWPLSAMEQLPTFCSCLPVDYVTRCCQNTASTPGCLAAGAPFLFLTQELCSVCPSNMEKHKSCSMQDDGVAPYYKKNPKTNKQSERKLVIVSRYFFLRCSRAGWNNKIIHQSVFFFLFSCGKLGQRERFVGRGPVSAGWWVCFQSVTIHSGCCCCALKLYILLHISFSGDVADPCPLSHHYIALNHRNLINKCIHKEIKK